MNTKQKAIFKIAVWSALIVWSVMFITMFITVAVRLAAIVDSTFDGLTKDVIGFALPTWAFFTALLLVVMILRWTHRKLI